MNKKFKILIIGAGFAGIWSALSAMRHCHLLHMKNQFEIIVINKDEFHGLRPRFYESDLSKTRIPLHKILTPFSIQYIIAEVIAIDTYDQQVQVMSGSKLEKYQYDRLIFAAGSILNMPDIPGLKEYSFNVDTYDAAVRLDQHLRLLDKKPLEGRYTAVVIGGGFTGIEVATELITRMKKITHEPEKIRVIIMDRQEIGHTLGAESQHVALTALTDLGIETKTNIKIKTIHQNKIDLLDDESITTQTVIWTAGMRANPLTQLFPVSLDQFGRLKVNPFLQIEGIDHCFAAGDVCVAMTDDKHPSLLMCQHAMPQGRYAGHNAVADLLNLSLLPYEQKKLVSIVDLGIWGALYAEGWDLKLISQGNEAKKIKAYVNHQRICPIENGDFSELMSAAEPEFKAMPLT